jgi:hypothetical protein
MFKSVLRLIMRACLPIPIMASVNRLDGAFFPKTVDETIVGKADNTPAVPIAPSACRRVMVVPFLDPLFIVDSFPLVCSQTLVNTSACMPSRTVASHSRIFQIVEAILAATNSDVKLKSLPLQRRLALQRGV